MSGDAGLADEPERGVTGLSLHVLASAAIVLTILAVLWPPTDVYLRALQPFLGEAQMLAIVGTLAVGLGAWVGRTTGFGVATLALGSVVGFGIGMGAIEVVLEPDSAAHLVRYGALTASIVGGAFVWTVLERYRSVV